MTEKRRSIKVLIRSLLFSRPWMFKGAIEDSVREIRGAYGDTVARRLRELTEAGEIVKGERDGRTTYTLP